MSNKKKLFIGAVVALWGWSVAARAIEHSIAKEIIKSDEVKLGADQTLRVVIDKGELDVLTAKGPTHYEIEISPDLGSRPSQKDYDDSIISFTPEHGLSVTTGEHLEANVKLWVPSRQALESRLWVGTSLIGPLTGKVDAQVKVGTLEFDASALPRNACVAATVNMGSVDNQRDFDCKRGDITLHVNTGHIVVK